MNIDEPSIANLAEIEVSIVMKREQKKVLSSPSTKMVKDVGEEEALFKEYFHGK